MMGVAVDRRRRRLGSALFVSLVLAMMAAVAASIMTAYEVGLATGLMGAGTAFLIYSVPATLFDWPRITLEALLDFFQMVWDAITSIFD